MEENQNPIQEQIYKKYQKKMRNAGLATIGGVTLGLGIAFSSIIYTSANRYEMMPKANTSSIVNYQNALKTLDLFEQEKGESTKLYSAPYQTEEIKKEVQGAIYNDKKLSHLEKAIVLTEKDIKKFESQPDIQKYNQKCKEWETENNKSPYIPWLPMFAGVGLFGFSFQKGLKKILQFRREWNEEAKKYSR